MLTDSINFCGECNSRAISFDERLGEMVCDECGLVIITEIFEETVRSGSRYSPDKGTLGSITLGKGRRNYNPTPSHILQGLSFCKILLANFSSAESLKLRCERIYMTLYKKNIFSTRDTYEDRASAVVYYCLLENNTPVNYIDICSIEFNSEKAKVIKLVKKIKKHFGTVNKRPTPIYEIERMASLIASDAIFTKQAIEVHEYFYPIIEESGFNIPISYPASICWLAANINLRSDITCQVIHRHSKLSKWTIRNTGKNLLNLIGLVSTEQIKGKQLI